jgi:methionyl-tRNA synthetase
MLRAEKDGITPEALIERVHGEHSRDFAGFHVAFDNFYTTHSKETQDCANTIYARLKEAGLIEKRTIEQYYDPVKQMFLPDRFIKGECPKCGAKDQYGDNCESCGAAYTPNDLKNPYSAISGAKPELRNSDHYFFKLSSDRLPELPAPLDARARPPAVRSLEQDAGMARRGRREQADRLGHLARRAVLRLRDPRCAGQVLLRLARRADRLHGLVQEPVRPRGIDFDEYFKPDSENRALSLHRQGHPLLPRAVLAGRAEHAGYRTPSGLCVHGFLTVDGAKMSKSRGTFITAESYLNTGLNPEWLRYYYAAKLNSTMEDIDLNLEDFVARVNSDLVGKYVNIASRCAGFIGKKFDGKLASTDAEWLKPLRDAPHRSPSLRGARVQPRAARNHGAGRRGQRLRQRQEAVGARQAGRQGSRPARRLLASHRSLPPAHAVPEAGAAESRRSRRSLPQHRAADLDRRGDTAARRPRDQRLQPPDDARRSEADRRAGRSQQGLAGPGSGSRATKTCRETGESRDRSRAGQAETPARTSRSTTS